MTLTFIKKLKGKYKGFRFNTVGVCEELAQWIRSGGEVYIRGELYNNPDLFIARFKHLETNENIIVETRV